MDYIWFTYHACYSYNNMKTHGEVTYKLANIKLNDAYM